MSFYAYVDGSFWVSYQNFKGLLWALHMIEVLLEMSTCWENWIWKDFLMFWVWI